MKLSPKGGFPGKGNNICKGLKVGENGPFEKLEGRGVPRAMACTGRSGQVSSGLHTNALAGLAEEPRPFTSQLQSLLPGLGY